MNHLPNPTPWRRDPPATLDEWADRALETVRQCSHALDNLRDRFSKGGVWNDFGDIEEEWSIFWEMRDYQKRQDRRDRWQGLLATLRERAKCEDNYSLNRLQRWAYTAKVAICIMLGIEFRPKPAHALVFHFSDADNCEIENTVIAYQLGFNAKTARHIEHDRKSIENSWPPMNLATASMEAISRLDMFHDGWCNVDFIDTGTISSHSDGYGWGATWMSVPRGWRRWGYHVHSDGESSY